MRHRGSTIIVTALLTSTGLAFAQIAEPVQTTQPAVPELAAMAIVPAQPSRSTPVVPPLAAVQKPARQLLSDRALATAIAWQIALEREGFSPGLIDGKIGPKAKAATEWFQRYKGLPVTGVLDTATHEALKADPDTAVFEYTVQASDLEGIHPMLDDWNERAKLTYMGYYDALDAIAEKFHTTKARILAMNPGVSKDSIQAGTILIAPAIQDSKPPKASALRIDLKKKHIYPLDDKDNVIGLFHCSIAASVEKRPSGQTKVITAHRDPDYTFDPKSWPEVNNVTRRLLISPGPRNPVGMAWIGLDLPGYGIHGTPHPEMIGKTGSHGCFRMTNWDAVRLSKMIRPGATVTFVAQ